MYKPGREEAVICTRLTGRTIGQFPWHVARPVAFYSEPTADAYKYSSGYRTGQYQQ